MPDTRTERIEFIVKYYLEDEGLYTIANSIRALLEERNKLRQEIEAHAAFYTRKIEELLALKEAE